MIPINDNIFIYAFMNGLTLLSSFAQRSVDSLLSGISYQSTIRLIGGALM